MQSFSDLAILIFGYNRDGEKLSQINLDLVYGQQSTLPVTYSHLPGSINDVSTLDQLLDQFKKLGFSKPHLQVDRGFYSKTNVDWMAEAGHHFTIGVPICLKWVREILDADRDLVDGTAGYHKHNREAVTAVRKQYVGFSAILSTKFKDPLQALDVYREKDVAETCFDDLKNGLDLKRLRMHQSKRMQSRLFVQFIALILQSAIRQVIKTSLPKSLYSVQSLLWELESLVTIQYSGRYKYKQSELTKAQRTILEAFDIEVDAWL